MTRNIGLLETTMQFINDHEDKHDQEIWFGSPLSDEAITQSCETAACFGGWAVLLNGYQHRGNMVYDRHDNCVGDVYEVATDLLGLEDWEAKVLFNTGNTRAMLALMVKDLVNGDELQYRDEYVFDACLDGPEDCQGETHQRLGSGSTGFPRCDKHYALHVERLQPWP